MRVAVLGVLLISVVAGMRNAPAAHAATAPPHSTFTVTFGATVYHLTAGQSIRFPVTFADGSRGFEEFGSSANAPIVLPGSFAIASPDTVIGGGTACQNQAAWLSGVNIYGQTIWTYTMYQQWCYDGTSVVSHNNPTYSWWVAPAVGWSLANHAEWTAFISSTQGQGEGTMRANGPFGIGCASGETLVTYYGDGSYNAIAGPMSEYGC